MRSSRRRRRRSIRSFWNSCTSRRRRFAPYGIGARAAKEPPERRPHRLKPVPPGPTALTAPGQMFEMEELDIRGVPTRTWKNAPPSLRAVLDLSLQHGDATFLVYEDERTTSAVDY